MSRQAPRRYLTPAASPTPRDLLASAGAALAVAALAAAAVGSLEALPVVAGAGPRYASWAVRVLAIAAIGYLLLGLLLSPLALLGALAARASRRAPASVPWAAAVGGGLGVGAFVVSSQVGSTLLPFAVLGAALVAAQVASSPPARALEALARPAFWLAAVGLLLAVGLAAIAWNHAAGAARWLGAVAAAGAVVLALLGLVESLSRRGRPAGAAAGAVALAALGLTLVAARGDARGPGGEPRARTSVVLVTLDTLRADHVGCYGYERPTTPHVDALAAGGVVFERALTQANTTAPSHVTMLSGLHPIEHGTVNNGIPLDDEVLLLPQVLSEAGYATAAFVSGFTLVDEACGLAGRFDRYDDRLSAWSALPDAAEELRLVRNAMRLAERFGRGPWRADRPAGETVDAALSWLDGHVESDPERPFFLWVHCYDPHVPYQPPAPWDERFGAPQSELAAELDGNWYTLSTSERRELVEDEAAVRRMVDLYDGEIAYADEQVGRLLDALRGHGLLDGAVVVVTSDHGEGLGEHDYWFDHGTFLYDTELRVPLVVRLPGGRAAGTRVAGEARLQDLAPTLLELLGLPGLEAADRTSSLLPAVEAGRVAGERPSVALSFVSGDLSGYDLDGRKLSLRTRDHKLIQTSEVWLDAQRVAPTEELYDLRRDPAEAKDLLRAPLDPAARTALEGLREALAPWRELAFDAGGQELSEELREQLRKLGYL